MFPFVPLPLDTVVSLSEVAFPIPVEVLSTSQLCIALWPPEINKSVLLSLLKINWVLLNAILKKMLVKL